MYTSYYKWCFYLLCLACAHVTTSSVETVSVNDVDDVSDIFDDVIDEIEANGEETNFVLGSEFDSSIYIYILFGECNHIPIFLDFVVIDDGININQEVDNLQNDNVNDLRNDNVNDLRNDNVNDLRNDNVNDLPSDNANDLADGGVNNDVISSISTTIVEFQVNGNVKIDNSKVKGKKRKNIEDRQLGGESKRDSDLAFWSPPAWRLRSKKRCDNINDGGSAFDKNNRKKK
jgi:hypothetical protein